MYRGLDPRLAMLSDPVCTDNSPTCKPPHCILHRCRLGHTSLVSGGPVAGSFPYLRPRVSVDDSGALPPSRFPSNCCPGQSHLGPVKFAFGAGFTQAISSGRNELAAAVLGIRGAKYPWRRGMYRLKPPREFFRTRGGAYLTLTASAHALVGLCPLGDDWPMA